MGCLKSYVNDSILKNQVLNVKKQKQPHVNAGLKKRREWNYPVKAIENTNFLRKVLTFYV